MDKTFVTLILAVSVSYTLSYSTQHGTSDYVSYQVGGANTKVIISAPHGGYIEDVLPVRRTAGCYNAADMECTYDYTCQPLSTSKCDASTGRDYRTRELAIELADYIASEYGDETGRPHVIINELHRELLDANREIREAAFGTAAAEQAWREYHAFIDTAKQTVTGNGGRALFIDVHGQNINYTGTGRPYLSHVGFLIPDDGSNGVEKTVLPDRLMQYSSITQLHVDSGVSIEELVRGDFSIGGYMQNAAGAWNMLPSPAFKDADGYKYYTGGYNLRRHTGWSVSGFQIEAHYEIRRSTSLRRAFAQDLAKAVTYWVNNYL